MGIVERAKPNKNPVIATVSRGEQPHLSPMMEEMKRKMLAPSINVPVDLLKKIQTRLTASESERESILTFDTKVLPQNF